MSSGMSIDERFAAMEQDGLLDHYDGPVAIPPYRGSPVELPPVDNDPEEASQEGGREEQGSIFASSPPAQMRQPAAPRNARKLPAPRPKARLAKSNEEIFAAVLAKPEVNEKKELGLESKMLCGQKRKTVEPDELALRKVEEIEKAQGTMGGADDDAEKTNQNLLVTMLKEGIYPGGFEHSTECYHGRIPKPGTKNRYIWRCQQPGQPKCASSLKGDGKPFKYSRWLERIMLSCPELDTMGKLFEPGARDLSWKPCVEMAFEDLVENKNSEWYKPEKDKEYLLRHRAQMKQCAFFSVHEFLTNPNQEAEFDAFNINDQRSFAEPADA